MAVDITPHELEALQLLVQKLVKSTTEHLKVAMELEIVVSQIRTSNSE